MPKNQAIKLVKNVKDCAILETTPRYDVLLHGQKVGQLYFNMRGYVGTLPTPEGTSLIIGEKGINAYRREVAVLNREFAAAAKAA